MGLSLVAPEEDVERKNGVAEEKSNLMAVSSKFGGKVEVPFVMYIKGICCVLAEIEIPIFHQNTHGSLARSFKTCGLVIC